MSIWVNAHRTWHDTPPTLGDFPTDHQNCSIEVVDRMSVGRPKIYLRIVANMLYRRPKPQAA
jgi:hypothetical protein